MKGFFKKVSEAVATKIIVTLLIILLVFFYSKYLIKLKNIIALFNFSPFLTFSLIIIVIILSVILIIKNRRAKNKGIAFASFRTRDGTEKEIPIGYGGVKWISYIPGQLSHDPFIKDEYVWIKGPFCPNCVIELEWKKGIRPYWQCLKCRKKFRAFAKTERECEKLVKEECYSKFFRKKKFDGGT